VRRQDDQQIWRTGEAGSDRRRSAKQRHNRAPHQNGWRYSSATAVREALNPGVAGCVSANTLAPCRVPASPRREQPSPPAGRTGSRVFPAEHAFHRVRTAWLISADAHSWPIRIVLLNIESSLRRASRLPRRRKGCAAGPKSYGERLGPHRANPQMGGSHGSVDPTSLS